MTIKSGNEILKNAIARERKARKEAERLLERKSLELFGLSEQLRQANDQLMNEVVVKSKKLKVQERKYERLIEIAQDVIFTITVKGEFIYVNPAVASVLGYTVNEFMSINGLDIVPEAYKPDLISFYSSQLKKRVPSSYREFPILHKNGAIKWVGVQLEIIKDYEEIQFLGIARDITSTKEQRDSLESMSARLKKQATFLQEINEYVVSILDKHSIADIAREVTDRLIAKLDFEDCVIYILDDGLLKQVAANGAKEKREHLAINSLEKIGGVGIITHVALTGESIIVDDATIDSRINFYNQDNLSLLVVPIITNGEVIGVIESKHSTRQFFTGHHLTFVETIASLIGAKIKATNVMELSNDRIRRSEEKYRGVIENMKLGLMEVDADGVITKPYNSFCSMTGYRSEELIGKKAIEVFLEDKQRNVVRDQDDARLGGESGLYEIEMLKKDGGKINVLISGAPFYDDAGEVAGSIGIHYDITDLKRLQLDLEEARQIAENAREAQKVFLANMSHEIRNPIHSIGGMSELLASTELSTIQSKYLKNIQSASQILRALVSDILDISKIDEGKMEMRPSIFDLSALLGNIKDYAYTLVRSKDVHFIQQINKNVPTWLNGDTTFLNQILMNIINNAVKFTSSGNIVLRALLVSTTPEQATIKFTVEDTGKGIPKDKLDKIFDRFSQAGYASKVERKGTGLGLAIVKKLVEIMGGSIYVESQLGKGSKFDIQIPFGLVKGLNIPKAEVSAVGSKLNILIVEDSEMNRAYLEQTLTEMGHNWISSANGHEGLMACASSVFDLILADIRMPEMGGYEMTEILRKSSDNVNRYTPIIALTASALLDEKEKALASGMNYHLPKPFTKEQLSKAIVQFHSNVGIDSSEKPTLTLTGSIDQAILDELYDGDWNHTLLMMQVFLQTADNVLVTLEEHYKERDWGGIESQLHKIKPGLMMIGLSQGHDYVVKMEDLIASSENDDRKFQELFDEFLREFKSALPSVGYAIRQIKDYLKANAAK